MNDDTTGRVIPAHPKDWNIDGDPETRPGVPMEWSPHPFPGAPSHPAQQSHGRDAVAGLGVDPTPVFGTALPPRRLSGMIRRAAYRVPDHRASHWLLLMAADRMDVVEHRLARVAISLPLVGLAAGVVLLASRAYRRNA